MSVIPVGYLTLFEAAERLRQVRCKIAGPKPSNKEQFGAWYAKLQHRAVGTSRSTCLKPPEN